MLANQADENTWRSVLYAILEGASESLGIRREDLVELITITREVIFPL
jgi:hypothetical protein